MIAHQAEAQYHHIVLQNAQGDIIHRRNKVFPALKNIILLQCLTTHMIVIFLFPYVRTPSTVIWEKRGRYPP